jgi:DNA-binding NtrC family response regulator
MLRRGGNLDLAVVDFAMPVLDGLGFISAARIERPELPIVMMTGYADAGRLNEEELGDVPLLAKPFKLDALLGIINRRLDERGRAPGSLRADGR